jgi:hypothetical protein
MVTIHQLKAAKIFEVTVENLGIIKIGNLHRGSNGAYIHTEHVEDAKVKW